MSRDVELYLSDIREACRRIQNYSADSDNYESFAADQKTVDAVIRNIEIIGEAAKNVPEDVRKNYPSIPWREIAGMRDKIVHHYFGVDHRIVWAVASEKIRSLLQALT